MKRNEESAFAYNPPPYLRNLRQLTVHDEEHQRLCYQLRVALQSITTKVLSVHAINSPQQDAIFEANHVGSLVLDSWVNGRDLPEENSIHNVIHHGGRFRITDPNKGAIFGVGIIQFDDSTPQGPQQYEFLFCRIALGRSFVVDPEQLGLHGIPTGYDSISIHKEAEVDPGNYAHAYVINDESRIYPAFIINFVFDVTVDRMKQIPQCEACDARPAVLYCIQDNAKLCETCDRIEHNKSKIAERHSRVLLKEMQTSVGMTMCAEHKNVPVQYFDPISHVPVCIHCKMTGSHSTGENATHQLVQIQDAYQASMDDLDRESSIVEDRRRVIHQQLESVDRRMKLVNANHERAQDEIFEIVQRTVQILHEETQSKLSALLSDEFELRRQLEYYAWMENYLQYQRSCINPIEFLGAFKNHSSVLAQAPSEIVDSAANVRADIRIVGQLEVVVDDSNPALYPIQNQPPQPERSAQVKFSDQSKQMHQVEAARPPGGTRFPQTSGPVSRAPGRQSNPPRVSYNPY